MLIMEIWKVALQAIRANKLRSFLTMLGIIFGVGAVITMMAIGSGAQKAVQDNISALGTNLLTVVPGQSFMRGVASDVRVSLTVADADTLRNAGTAHILSVMPEIGRPLQVKRGSQNINVSITGVVPEYFPAHTYVATAGAFFTAGDDQQRRRVALLGSAVPDMFQANPVAMVGQQILIRGIPFDIIGVLGAKGSQSSFMNPDEQIFIPLNTARYRVHGTDRVRAIGLQVDNGANMNLAMIEAERALRRTHKIRPGGDNDFQIRNQADLMATLNATTQTLGALLAAVAAVSLLVGGIGIMNIMMVSVTERTREIGVRKALGATRGAILFQFLVEALVLCLVGGAFGILGGSALAVLMSRLAHWNTLISPLSIGLAFIFSFMVGLFFGVWPARRASLLDPIVALRYE